jgi:uncharacterized membrane protein YdjX (TVP38/TMEM64 family)
MIMTLAILEIVVLFWAVLTGIGFGLISWRSDGFRIFAELERMVTNHRFPLNVFTFFLIVLIMPMSIPFSIIHIWRNGSN